MEIKINERYKEFPKETQKFIKLLLNDEDKIDAQYIPTVDLIAQNHELLIFAFNDLRVNGAVSTDSRQRNIKNHNIQIWSSCMTNLKSLISSFPSSPLSKAKMDKLNNALVNDDNEANEFYDKIMNL